LTLRLLHPQYRLGGSQKYSFLALVMVDGRDSKTLRSGGEVTELAMLWLCSRGNEFSARATAQVASQVGSGQVRSCGIPHTSS
jgi:hypothetical protein